MRVRHFNRAELPVRRYADGSQTTYPRRVTRVAASRGGRRYDRDARLELADARPPATLAALRDRLAAMGFTADSPARLDPEAEQLARAEHRA